MTEELALLLCPFCGGCARIGIVSFDGSPDMYRVGCMVCGGGVELYDTKEEAKAAWNNRVEPDTLPSWAIEAINTKLQSLHSKVVEPDILNSYEIGGFQSLKWVLSLRKPEEKE